jgi:hypothetical protein
MSIREAINGNPKVGAITAGAFLVLALLFGYRYYVDHPSVMGRIGTTFYSDDDGQTYYRDSLYKFTPRDDGGKTAVIALVFSDGTQNFVGLLQRYTPDAEKRLEDEYAKVRAGSETLAQFNVLFASSEIRNSGTEVKLPGSGNDWVLRSKNPKFTLKTPSGGPCWMIQP